MFVFARDKKDKVFHSGRPKLDLQNETLLTPVCQIEFVGGPPQLNAMRGNALKEKNLANLTVGRDSRIIGMAALAARNSPFLNLNFLPLTFFFF